MFIYFGYAPDLNCTLTRKPPKMNSETQARSVHSASHDEYTHNDAHPAFLLKLIIGGNHKPKIHRQDSGLLRRMVLIPGPPVDPDMRDKRLRDRLMLELPAITQWCLEGAARWFDGHLPDTPEAWREATAEYHQDEDPLAAWCEEFVVEDPKGFAAGADLTESVTRFGIPHIGITQLYEWLIERFEGRVKQDQVRPDGEKNAKRGIRGVSVLQPPPPGFAPNITPHP